MLLGLKTGWKHCQMVIEASGAHFAALYMNLTVIFKVPRLKVTWRQHKRINSPLLQQQAVPTRSLKCNTDRKCLWVREVLPPALLQHFKLVSKSERWQRWFWRSCDPDGVCVLFFSRLSSQRSSSTFFVFSTRTSMVGGRSPSPSLPSRWGFLWNIKRRMGTFYLHVELHPFEFSV